MIRLLSISAFLFLLSTAWPLWHLCKAMGRTALRSACVWSALAAGLWTVVAALAIFEPQAGTWIGLGLLRLLSISLVLAPIVAVLGARWPGERAWNLIVFSLLVVFVLPVLEQWLLGKRLESDRVGMDGPRLTFYASIVAVGAVNYLPTRFGIAALFFGLGIVMQMSAVGPWNLGDASLLSAFNSAAGVLTSVAVWIAFWMRSLGEKGGLDGAWLRFRDGWGLVWAARIRDRWNSAAKQYGWPMRIIWNGIERRYSVTAHETQEMAAAEEHFRWLLRRFANPDDFIRPSNKMGTRSESSRCLSPFC